MNFVDNEILWQASQTTIEASQYHAYRLSLARNRNLKFDSYHEIHDWSVSSPDAFWLSIYEYFKVIDHGNPVEIQSKEAMPDTTWFRGSKVSYAEHIFRNASNKHPALISLSESGEKRSITWRELESQVASLRVWLMDQGITKGDRVVGLLPNIPETIVAFLATNSLGAVWSCCSPDFGKEGIIDRFAQLEPKIFISCDGYFYKGKAHDKVDLAQEIATSLDSIKKVVLIPYVGRSDTSFGSKFTIWQECLTKDEPLEFTAVEFSDPIWVLFSSGTTGKPKAITHGQGGMLLEHLKYMVLQNDVKKGELFFWYTTTGWMMWNFLTSSMLAGGVPVLYEGSPSYPNMNRLWTMIDELGIQHFGTSAPYLISCMKQGLRPKEICSLSTLRSLGSTGAPLPPEVFDWCYENIKSDLWLCSISGGTDMCTAFVGSHISLPVRRGKLQAATLGCALEAYDEAGNSAAPNTVGEMVITQPMPCMPIYFWNDSEKTRYRSSYFNEYVNIWRHGDWIEIDEHRAIRILGRSDATLNRNGIRIGSAEIYRVLNNIPQIQDSIVINIERKDGSHWMPLFVVLKDHAELDPDLIKNIKNALRTKGSPRHVPDTIISVREIPYTLSGKKLEAPIKKLFLDMPVEKIVNKDALRNPEALEEFVKLANEFLGKG